MTIYSEKDYLLHWGASEVSTIPRPSFRRLLTSSFPCLPNFARRPQLPEYPEQESDDEELVDLPHQTSLPVSSLQAPEKLRRLRQLMKKHNVGVYIVPSEDEHQTESPGNSERRVEFISEFTGSAGVCVISLLDGDELSGEAALSTDGRYFLQAEKQLDGSCWTLLKQGVAGYAKWTQFAVEQALKSKFSNVISCDPRVLNLSVGEYFDKASRFSYQNRFKFQPILDLNLVDEVWGAEKPLRSSEPVYPYELKYSGETVNSKLKRVRETLQTEFQSSHLIVTALDDVAWLFNLRSDFDILYTPTFYSYAVVTLHSVVLYIDRRKIDNGSQELRQHLAEIDDLTIKSYDEFYPDLSGLKQTTESSIKRLVLPSKNVANYALWSSIPQSTVKQTAHFHSIVSYMKLYKNKTELFNCKIAQYKDSLAFIFFSSWLEHQLINKKRRITEWDAACKIYAIRSKFPNFKDLSYETISSSGPNGSIIHYAPTKEEHSVIDPDLIYLVDSGGQYLEGTTDITRTYKFGKNVAKEDRKLYTLVLKGHLSVAMAKFPPHSSNTGAILDSYSRQALWNEGLDFNHGTGHGVGSFGVVHEAPLYIASAAGTGTGGQDLFAPGGVLTIEPGYYLDGVKGFRVESEIEIIQCDDSLGKTRSGENFLGFRYLTKVPFCAKLIDKSYLTSYEVTWINEFHKSIRSDFGDKLLEMGETRAFRWLMKETEPI